MTDKEQKKAFLLASLGPNAPKSINAKDMINELSPLIDGKGGGKPELAQAGGSKPAGLNKAIESARKVIEKKLSC